MRAEGEERGMKRSSQENRVTCPACKGRLWTWQKGHCPWCGANINQIEAKQEKQTARG